MADKCISLEDIDHNLGCDGGNAAGIVPSVIFGYWDDVAVWPDEPKPTVTGGTTTPMTLEESGKLVGDLVMKAGTCAFKFDFTEDTGNFAVTTEGETDGVSFISTLNMIKAKIVARVFGFMNASVRKKMFFIVQDENGTYYLMGNKKRGATFVTGGDGASTGTTGSDRNQTSLSYTFRSALALTYDGDVETLLVVAP